MFSYNSLSIPESPTEMGQGHVRGTAILDRSYYAYAFDPQQKEWHLSYLPIAPSTEAAVDTPEVHEFICTSPARVYFYVHLNRNF